MRINFYTTVCLLKRKHPYIALAFLFLLFKLQDSEPQDDNNNIIKVLVSALLLKSDDPHQKPKNFPRLANPPQAVVHEEQTRVLLLAYARSGSSFVGELLTTGTTSFYFFEPFYALRPNGTIYEDYVDSDSGRWIASKYLDNLLSCQPILLRELSTAGFPVIQRNPALCPAAKFTLAKTIRLRGSHLKEWLQRSDVKVCLKWVFQTP